MTPTGASLAEAGARTAFQVLDVDGRPIGARWIDWSSLNPAVATIDPETGEAVAVSSGQAVIEAEVQGSRGYALLTVSVPAEPIREWRVERPPSPPLAAVWGASDSSVFAVGTSGVIRRYDGHAVTTMESGTSDFLRGVSGTSDTDVWAVGPGYSILHYDGHEWTEVAQRHLTRVWAGSPTDAWAVGANRAVLHYDGSVWQWVDAGVGPSTDLWDAWGSGPADVFAVGDDGTILHYDGSGWSAMESGTDVRLYTVWGSGPADVYAVGGNWGAAFLHYDGTGWSPVEVSFDARGLAALGGSGPEDVWVAGSSEAYHFDGETWTADPPPSEVEVGALWVSASGRVHTVGWDGSMAVRGPVGWRVIRAGGETRHVAALWGVAAGDVVGGGYSGLLFDWIDDSLHAANAGNWPNSDIEDIWGASGSDIYAGAIGAAGSPGLLHYDGTRWDVVETQIEIPGEVRAVWGAAPDDFFVFSSEAILHRAPDGWETTPIPSLYDAWGTASDNIFAVGVFGAGVYHYDGHDWSGYPGTGSESMHGIWGTSATDIFAVGLGILHFDGTAWTSMDTPYDGWLETVWGTSPEDVYAAGGRVILHYDGSAWRIVHESDYHSAYFRAGWGSSSSDAYLGGQHGLLVRGVR